MPETYGKGQFTTCQDKISFGSSMPIWRSSLGSTREQEIFSLDGWIGVQEKRLGCPSLSSKREWVSLRTQRLFSTDIYRPTRIWTPI